MEHVVEPTSTQTTTGFERSLDNPPLPRNTLWRGMVFRFAFVYWALFCIPIISTQITGFDWIGKAIGVVWDRLVVWVGEAILQIPYPVTVEQNGSGDKTADWVFVFCVAAMSLIATVVWSLLDRRRAHDRRLREALRVLVRYTLAFTILGYGVIKLFFGQFPLPNANRLLQRYGDSSPMGLMWTFMGASPAYVFFSGASETLGAVLLLFRRTTTLGALLLSVVLTNIVMMNFCYDVPVKINSSHYLAMCIFLVLPELGRLANVLVFHRPTQPVAYGLVLPRRWMRIARVVIKVVLIVAVGFTTVNHSRKRGQEVVTWYSGIWAVTTFHRDGVDVPATDTDKTRWKRLRFAATPDAVFLRPRFMDDSPGDLYKVKVDDKARTMTLTFDEEGNDHKPTSSDPTVLTYTRADDAHFKLEGKIDGHALVLQVERLDVSHMLLLTRGFHWINEEPFNR